MTARQPSTLSNFDDLRRITAGKVADTLHLDQLLLGPFTCTAAESIRPIYTSIYFRPGRQGTHLRYQLMLSEPEHLFTTDRKSVV